MGSTKAHEPPSRPGSAFRAHVSPRPPAAGRRAGSVAARVPALGPRSGHRSAEPGGDA